MTETIVIAVESSIIELHVQVVKELARLGIVTNLFVDWTEEHENFLFWEGELRKAKEQLARIQDHLRRK